MLGMHRHGLGLVGLLAVRLGGGMLRGAGSLLGSIAVGLLSAIACLARISLLTTVRLGALGTVGRRLGRLQRPPEAESPEGTGVVLESVMEGSFE